MKPDEAKRSALGKADDFAGTGDEIFQAVEIFGVAVSLLPDSTKVGNRSTNFIDFPKAEQAEFQPFEFDQQCLDIGIFLGLFDAVEFHLEVFAAAAEQRFTGGSLIEIAGQLDMSDDRCGFVFVFLLIFDSTNRYADDQRQHSTQ